MREVQLPGVRLQGGQMDSYGSNIGTGVNPNCHVEIDRNLTGNSLLPIPAVGGVCPPVKT